MKTLILNPQKDSGAIKQAGDILKNGGLVAMPTETVYGLAANALDTKAVDKIFKAKGRPQDNPLIVHLSDVSEIFPLVAEIPSILYDLAEAFWPGPLTLVLAKSNLVPSSISAGLDTVAIRIPKNPIAQAIIKESALPLAAPSANISGFPSPTSFLHVYDDLFGRVDAIVDGGQCEIGLESTVLSIANETPRLLRPGSITLDQLKAVLGPVEVSRAVLNPLESGELPESPGMKHRHYSPKAKISVIKGEIDEFKKYLENNNKDGLALLCFDGEEKFFDRPCVSMGKIDDPLSQALNLFKALRRLDEIGAKEVFARCPKAEGIGLAVCNRLFRAADFRVFDASKLK